jgi:DNA-binding NtrC family response regulator
MAETVIVTTQDLEPAVRLRDAFRDEGYDVELLTPGERVSDVQDPVLLVLTGALRGSQALRLITEAKERDHLPVLGLLEPGTPLDADAKRSFQLDDAFTKPADPGEIARAGRRLIERAHLRRVTGIIGDTDAMLETLERVLQIAPVNSTVLITGESGTGKERVARGIHAISPRRHRPFIATNVAALPETLLEAELFGHEKGAFTGAIGQRKGFFELAHRGTLFLDEIGEMPLSTQTKLLRVLEELHFRRLGGEAEIEVDVRVIAATNQPLRQLVEIGRFRRDLYFRINVLHIELPPLRMRRDDIPLLAAAFVRDATREHGRPHDLVISPEAMRVLEAYDWPGNVRELKNLIESMVVLSPGRAVKPEDIPPEIREAAAGGSRLLPVPIPRPLPAESSGTAPELEFIFRTLLQLRIDIEDLRHQFDQYRRTHSELAPPLTGYSLPAYQPPPHHIEDVQPTEDELAAEHEVVVFRPGMTLQDLEKNAITAALREVAGNRRKAAEMLGMGERTLYRKIKEFGIPL